MNDDFLKVAKEAALEAGKIISKYLGKTHTISIKNDDGSDLATEADLQAEEKIVEILTKNFPDHNILAEEKTKINNNSDYTWVIDPLDGTISFKVGMPFFAVAIGLLKNNKPFLGVIYHVLAKELYFAKQGKGAFLNGKPIHVSRQETLPAAVMAVDTGHLKRRAKKIERYILPLLSKVGYVYSIGSGVMCMGLVAKGIQDGMTSQGFPWDVVAGAIIIQEAGGRVSDMEGQEPDWEADQIQIVASNGLIHDQILEVLKV